VKLVVAVVHADDAGPCSTALTDAGYDCTRIGSAGGFLQKGNATLLCGVDDTEVEAVIDVLRRAARSRNEYLNPLPPMTEPAELFVPFPVEVQIGGATVFVLDVTRFEKI